MQRRVAIVTRRTYEQVHADYRWLSSEYEEPSDMTGGVVDGDLFRDLLANPTKRLARDMMIGLIQHWFDLGPEGACGVVPWHDPGVREIAKRYDIKLPPEYEDECDDT
jgi:hypothetical protein